MREGRGDGWGEPQTWSNLGACHKEAGEVLAGEGRAQLAEEQYEKAVEAYGKACSLCSAAAGDDLPSLLHDWGVALYSYASYTTVRMPPFTPPYTALPPSPPFFCPPTPPYACPFHTDIHCPPSLTTVRLPSLTA